jgi:hypothetical protein
LYDDSSLGVRNENRGSCPSVQMRHRWLVSLDKKTRAKEGNGSLTNYDIDLDHHVANTNQSRWTLTVKEMFSMSGYERHVNNAHNWECTMSTRCIQ